MTAFIAFSSLDAGLEMPDTWSPHRVPPGAMKTKGGGDSHRPTLMVVSPEKDEK
jgi:hypothetical protein